MNEQFAIKKDYRNEADLRKSFNDLARATFGLDFENWYQNGYWTESYNPYSIVIENKVVANVSVNRMDFDSIDGKKRYIQLGTVMTDKEYRHQGLIKILMYEIEKDYQNIADDFYLFANSSVLEFYPKFGYRKSREYQYSKIINSNSNGSNKLSGEQAQLLPMKEKADWEILERAIETSANNSTFEMKNNVGLIMFYITQFMQENVYYIESEDAYVIAEIEGNKLYLQNVYSPQIVCIDKIMEAFGDEIHEVILGFVPQDIRGYQVKELMGKDTVLFIKGEGFHQFEQDKKMFPLLSHA